MEPQSFLHYNNSDERKNYKNKISRYESNNFISNNIHNNKIYNGHSYENDISNSSTFNSSGITKLKDNHYSRYFDMNDINNLKYSNKLLGDVKRKEIKERTASNFESEKFKKQYYRLNQEIQSERLNFPILKSSTNIPFLTECPIQKYKRYYHSRNLNNNEPIKILSIDNNTLTKTDESINQRRSTIENYHSNSGRRNYLRLNSISYKNLKNHSADSKKRKFNKIVSFNVDKSSENDLSHSNSDKYNGYIPNFKRIKSKNKAKKIIKKKMTKYLRELSKISERSNTNIFHLKPEKSLKKSISINHKKLNFKTEEKDNKKYERKTSFEISSNQVINSFCENDFFYKKNISKKTSESEEYESERFLLQKDLNQEKRNNDEFKLKYILPEKKSHKHEYQLYKFEDELKEDFQIINGNNFYYKNNLIANYINILKKKYNKGKKDFYKNIHSKTEYVKELKKDKYLKKHLTYFEKKVHKELKKRKIFKNFYNCSFSNSQLLYKYLSVDLSRLIFKENYLNNLNGDYFGNLLKNFSSNKSNLRRSSILKNKEYNMELLYGRKNLPEIYEIPSINLIFIIHFYQTDYEYNIVPSVYSVKIEKINLKINNIEPNLLFKQKKSKKINLFKKNSTKSITLDAIPSYKNEKFLLRNALSKISFYNRKYRRMRRSTLTK